MKFDTSQLAKVIGNILMIIGKELAESESSSDRMEE